MAKQPYPMPCPLFDTLEKLEEPPPICVTDYLNHTALAAAQQEFMLTLEFLKSYAGSPDTFTAYRRDVETFFYTGVGSLANVKCSVSAGMRSATI